MAHIVSKFDSESALAWGDNVLLARILAQEFGLNPLDSALKTNKTIQFCQTVFPLHQVKEQKGLELPSLLLSVIEFGLNEINLQIALSSACNISRIACSQPFKKGFQDDFKG